MAQVGWSRLHQYDPAQVEPASKHLAVGWHLWANRNARFPQALGPGFQYLITREFADGSRATDQLAVVHDRLPWVEVDGLAKAYRVASGRFGPELGVGVSWDDWFANGYNADHARTGRWFTVWSYTVFQVAPVDVGTYEGTFTGWKQLASVEVSSSPKAAV